jgi:hypothetical protein
VSISIAVSICLHAVLLGILPRDNSVIPSKRLIFPARTIDAKLVIPLSVAEPLLGEAARASDIPSGDYDGHASIDALGDAPAPARYLPANELDERPRMVEFSNFDDLSLPSQASGLLIVQFWIDENGLVDTIEIEQNNMPPEIARHLIEERRNMRFTAGRKNNVAVRSLVRYEFKLLTEAQSKAKTNLR